jgi:hypothetical protein
MLYVVLVLLASQQLTLSLSVTLVPLLALALARPATRSSTGAASRVAFILLRYLCGPDNVYVV